MFKNFFKDKNEYAVPILFFGIIDYFLAFYFIVTNYAHTFTPTQKAIPGYEAVNAFFTYFNYYSFFCLMVGIVNIAVFFGQTKKAQKNTLLFLISGIILCLPLYIFWSAVFLVNALLYGICRQGC